MPRIRKTSLDKRRKQMKEYERKKAQKNKDMSTAIDTASLKCEAAHSSPPQSSSFPVYKFISAADGSVAGSCPTCDTYCQNIRDKTVGPLQLMPSSSTAIIEKQGNNSGILLQENNSGILLQENNSGILLQENNSGILLQGNNSGILLQENNSGVLLKESSSDILLPEGNNSDSDILLPEGNNSSSDILLPEGNNSNSDILLPEGNNSNSDILLPEENNSNSDILLPEGNNSDSDILLPEGNNSNSDILLPEGNNSNSDILLPEENNSNSDILLPEGNKSNTDIVLQQENNSNTDIVLPQENNINSDILLPEGSNSKLLQEHNDSHTVLQKGNNSDILFQNQHNSATQKHSHQNEQITNENKNESNPDVISVFGSTHQGGIVFPRNSRGMQCTCNALVMLTKACSDFELGSELIDTVLLQGDILYNNIIESLKHQSKYKSSLLNFDELPENIVVDTDSYHVHKFNSITGIVLDPANVQTLTLQSGLDICFQLSDFALVMVGGLCSSIFYFSSTYYFFDSHSHGIDTLSSPDGKAIMMSFCSKSSLLQYLYQFYDSVNLLQNIQFEFQPLSIVRNDRVTDNLLEKGSCIINDNTNENQTARDNKCVSQHSDLMSTTPVHDGNQFVCGINFPCVSQNTSKTSNQKGKGKKRKRSAAVNRKLDKERKRVARTASLCDVSADTEDEINRNASGNDARLKENDDVEIKQETKVSQKRYPTVNRDQDEGRESQENIQAEHADVGHRQRMTTIINSYYASKFDVSTTQQRTHGNKCTSKKDRRKKRNEMYRRKYHSDPVFREKKKTTVHNKYYASDSFKKQVKLRTKQAARTRYRNDEQHREGKKKYVSYKYRTQSTYRQLKTLASSKKYKINHLHKQQVQHASIAKYKTNVQHRQTVRRASTDKYKRNVQHRQRLINDNRKRYRENAKFRERVQLHLHNKYLRDSAIRQKKINMVVKRRKEQKTKHRNLALYFRELVSDGPRYICCACHKFKFKKQVLMCVINKYNKKGRKAFVMAKRCITYAYATKCNDDCEPDCGILNHNKIWICHSCHGHIMKGEMPADAVSNNMHLKPMPNGLKKLNGLERQLLSLRIPFMKVVNLPKGQQKGVIGPCVSIPTDIEKSTSVLPRGENDELVRVKLKRKLNYKGHCQYQYVSPAKIHKAMQYLQENNPWYEGTSSNQNWENPIPDSNELAAEVNHCLDNQQDQQKNTESDKQTITADDDNDTEDEDLTRSRDKGLPFDTCLQPADMGQEILDQYFDGIFCVAPGEGKTPVSMLNETGNEAMSFPAQFPDGKGTYDDKREVRLTRLRYFHARLLNADSRFSSDTQYIFYAQYLAELEQVVSQVSIALRKGTTKDQCGHVLSANVIKDGDELRNLLKTDQGYKFLTPVRGTPPYWQTTLRDLFAMIRQLGIPTWFCTFSAADMRWTEIMEILLHQQGITKSPDELDYLEKCEILRNSAIMNAVNFDHRFHTFLKYIIIQQEVIGKVKDHFHRIEFQMRGSPHTHCLFWIEDAPFLDKDSDEEVCSFVNKYVSCKQPDENEDSELHEMVKSVQQHSKGHSKSCRKKGTTCRFNFPRPPSEKTFISRASSVTDPSNDLSPQQLLNQAKETLQKVWDVINNTDLEEITTTNLFAAAGITQVQFEEATNTLTKRTSIILERSPQDVWINQYNPTLLRCWNANMDIQYVTDAYSCVMYIISYISKAEREMGLILEEARKEATEGNLDAQSAMKKIGGTYFHHREVSAQEAAYRVCGLHLKESSRKVQFIPVGNDPVRMSKPISLIQKQTNDDEDIWLPSITDRYKARPSGQEFESLCLAAFCSKYRILASSQIPKDPSNAPHVHMLQNDLGFIRKRTQSEFAVVRYPRFSPNKDSELYFKSILQLFLPHRQDQQIKPSTFETFQDFYHNGAVKLEPHSPTVSVKSIVDANRQDFEIDADALEEAEELLEKMGPLEDAWAMIGPESEASRLECGIEKEQHVIDDDYDGIPELQTGKSQSNKDYSVEISNHTISKNDAVPLLQAMNENQKQVFYKVRQWCLDKVNGKDPESFRLFVTGGAGTGKSHLIKCIHYEAHRILSPSASNPDDTVVLLTAPTGTAAFNIGGTTLHQAFSLPQYLSLPYQHMRDEKLNTLRCKLQSLAILIIDEISMVGQKLLTYVHERLRQIKQTGNALFGNVCIIAVGDFYQLPPVRQTSLYELHPKNYFNLWTSNFAIVELNQIMRQQNDADFAEMLNRLRKKKKNEDLNADDTECLKACEEKAVDLDALHIFATNAEVDEHNKLMLEKLCEQPQTFMAQDFSKNITTGKLTRRDAPYPTSSDYLPSEISLAKGARVMLIRNVDVTDGLVNGVIGTIHSIMPPPPGSLQSTSVSITFDNIKVGQKQRKSTPSASSLGPNSVIVSLVEETLPKNAVRYQFPLRLAWACTVHKVQGLTTDKLVVSFKKMFGAGMAYVALSRITSLDGLMIKDFAAHKIYCTDTIADALQRMPSFLSQPVQSISLDTSKNILLHNIQGLIPHLKDLKSNTGVTDAHFICVTETWMEQQSTNPSIDSFELFHKTRFSCYNSEMPVFQNLKNMKHGGVGFFSKKNNVFEQLPIKQLNIEAIAFQASHINTTVLIVYRPDIYKCPLFLDQLDKLLEQLPQNRPTLVMGDFNQDLLKSRTAIQEFMDSKGYGQLVKASTTDGNTLIDHVYVKGGIDVTVNIIPTYYSYHNTISVNVTLNSI